MSKKIKVKGKCPVCGSECEYVVIETKWSYMDEISKTEIVNCTNLDCDNNLDPFNNIKYRWINHSTIKIDGVW